MIKIGVVSTLDISDEWVQDIMHLSELHWAEIAAHKNHGGLLKPPNHNPQYYQALERDRKLFMVLVEDTSIATIVGYCINIIVPNTFHPSELLCHGYGWYLHSLYRGKGYGLKALECSKQHARDEFDCARYNMAIPAGNESLRQSIESDGSMKLSELIYTQRL